MYTSHPTQTTSLGGQPEYQMTQLRTFAMTDSAETFRKGVTAYRNARDWAKEQRDKAIEEANERANHVERAGAIVSPRRLPNPQKFPLSSLSCARCFLQ
jgi:hypothetical protein